MLDVPIAKHHTILSNHAIEKDLKSWETCSSLPAEKASQQKDPQLGSVWGAFEPQQREMLPLTETQILLYVQNSKWSVTPSENLVSKAAGPGDYKLGATHSKLCGFALRGFGNRA